MWSSDVQSGYPTQWALNPSAYQNVSNEEVDWASLAQQWIKMKETFPSEGQMPQAPPPPALGVMSGASSTLSILNDSSISMKESEVDVSLDLEGGEAPMDMDTKDDNDTVGTTPSVASDSTGWGGTWNNWQQWGWGNNWPPPTASTSGTCLPTPTGCSDGKTAGPAAPVFPFPSNAVAAHNFGSEGAASYDYNNAPSSAENFNQLGYWMGGSTPYIRQKNPDWRHDRNPTGRTLIRGQVTDKSNEDEDHVPVIDAAKRKQLPAWIREGLEKMEKEKLKKLEKERMVRERELQLARQKEQEEQPSEQIPPLNRVPSQTKFDTDTDQSDVDDENEKEADFNCNQSIHPSNSRKSRFDQTSANLGSESPPRSYSQPPINFVRSLPPLPTSSVYKSKEQIMQEVMKKVRVVLTNILMCVTSEELEKAANEMLLSMRSKAPAKQHRKTVALTSLTGRLGLSMYNSDDDDSDGSQTGDDDDVRKDEAIDSDRELKERYEKRKLEFESIESDILTGIEKQEERERRQMMQYQDEEIDEHRSGNNNNNYDDHLEKINITDHYNYNRRRNSDICDADDHYHQVDSLSGHKVGDKRTDVENDSNTVEEYDLNLRSQNEVSIKPDSGESDDDDDDDSISSESSSSSSSSALSKLKSRKKKKHSSRKTKVKSGGEKRSHRMRSVSRSVSRSKSRSQSRTSDRKYRKSSHDSSYRKDYRYRKESEHRSKTRRDRSRSRYRDRDKYKRHSSPLSPSLIPHRRRKHFSSGSSHRRRRSTSSSDSMRSSSKKSSRDYRR